MSVSWQSGPPSFGDPVVWPSGSTVCVTGDLNVSDLTIEPGVQVVLQGNFEILVTNTLLDLHRLFNSTT